ncbi:MAG: DUF975 family protein [Lachnospiraceae bacterium]|nr:DUF975 family protein [Lachnospiraceae bacterium]
MEKAEKDLILRQRKELKKRAHEVFRSHYVLLAFLILVMAIFGVEFTGSLSGLEKRSGAESSENDPGNILSMENSYTFEDVLSDLVLGKLDEGSEKADSVLSNQLEAASDSKFLGRTNGVLAQILNGFSSGKLFIKLAQTIRTITHSDVAVGAIFILGSFLWYALIFILFKNMLSAVVRRIFLQARVYQHVSFLDVTHIAAVRKWLQASWTMIVQYFYYTLWSLTIVGAFVKYFSYWAVAYIVAENPSVKGRQALTLSRKMMDGHKWELFKFHLTLLGWMLLSYVTLGISDLIYGAGYRMACYTEFYAKIREDAIARKVPGIEALNDRYLFEQADRVLLYETYFDVVDEITDLHENRIVLTGWKKFFSEWFGVWFGSLSEKKAYEDQEGRAYAITRCRQSMEGTAYPQWLNPLWRKKKIEKVGNFSFLRSYTVWTLFLLFITFSFVGWTWEVALHLMQTGQFANRGTLHGPWLPIYGTGGVIVLILCSKFRKTPVAEFFTAILLSGILEYTSAWFLEMKYHQRWWSYDGYFLNLHGRICAEGLLVFGVGCCAVVYLLAPIFDFLISKIRQNVLIVICLVLAVIYGTDQIYSSKHPNMAEGAVEKAEEAETEGAAAAPEEETAEAMSEA